MRWHADGLYKIRLGADDSVRLGPTPFSRIGPFSAFSSDQAYAANGGVIMRLVDSTCIVLDTMSYSLPSDAQACGFAYVSFNPTRPEVLFNFSCDGGHAIVQDRIGVFDCESMELEIFDSLANGANATNPVYAPDGKRIAFLDCDNYRAYIVYREVRQSSTLTSPEPRSPDRVRR